VRLFALSVVVLTACGSNVTVNGMGGGSGTGGGSSAGGGAATGGGSAAGGGSATGGGSSCPASPLPLAGTEATLATEFQPDYTVYFLGAVPGVPNPLGGCVIRQSDPNHLLIAGASEDPSGGLYSIEISRDSCQHITGFVGTATQIASTPYIDANILEGADGTLLYTQWPVDGLAQLPMGANTPSQMLDLSTIGLGSSSDSPGGLGFVPPPLTGKGQLRSVTWPGGHWYHIQYSAMAGAWSFTASMESASSPLTGNPGGFAYVPAGSPGFPNQSLIVSEWSVAGTANDRVAVYQVDQSGDPMLPTRKEFFTKFPRPWGAYFEPATGDYLFLTWHGGGAGDSIYLVSGFTKPPPPPQIN
jgi:hypothetical protein